MGMQCSICAKKPSRGVKYSVRGKAKYLGGVGKKITGKTKRIFRPNLQHIQIQVAGETMRSRVCAACIRSGKIQRPQKRKPFTMPTSL